MIAAAENIAATVLLAVMVVLPLADAVLRKLTHTGISGSPLIVQHVGLVLSMLGSAIAAREGRLLALSTLGEQAPRDSWLGRLRAFAGLIGGLVAIGLAAGAWQFVETERHFGKTLVYGIPVWVVESALPVGFAAIAWRIVGRNAGSLKSQILLVVAAASFFISAAFFPDAPAWMSAPVIATLAAATVFGAPAFVALGGCALALFWYVGAPIASIAVSHYALAVNPSIPTLPLFTLAGYVLAESGAPRRLIRLFDALFGQVRGGAAVMTVVACTFFTSFTGGSGITIIALGGLLMPILQKARYSQQHALGLVTGAGSLGMLLPPCLPLIVYAIVAKVPMNAIFLGGVIPTVLMAAATTWWGALRSPRLESTRKPLDRQEIYRALTDAKWELLTPVVALAALFSGAATTVESAALTAFYVIVVEIVVHRDLSIRRDLPRVMVECALLVGGIMLILGVALGLMNYLVVAEIPSRAVDWATATIHSKWMFLLLLNVFLLIVGCLMDIFSAIIVQVPLLVPLGVAYGIDPVQLGIIFLANMELGYLTPPVGLNLYMSSYRFKKSVPEVFAAVIPIVIVLHVGVLLITYVPALTTTLPRLFGY